MKNIFAILLTLLLGGVAFADPGTGGVTGKSYYIKNSDGTNSGALNIYNAAGTYSVTQKVPAALSADATYTWPAAPTNGYILSTDTNGVLSWVSPGGGGTVTSIDVAVPAYMTTSGGPITTNGTITLGFGSIAANYVFASPTVTGGSPDFRALLAADIPSLSYANQTLSNLTSPTAINQSLIPSGTRNFGSTAHYWNAAFVNQVTGTTGLSLTAGDGSGNLEISAGQTILHLASGTPQNLIFEGSGGNVGFRAPDTVTTAVTWALPPADGSASQVLTTDGAGVLSWSSPASSGANTELSNLTGTVAVNIDLTPTSSGDIHLGSADHFWGNLYANNWLGAGPLTINTGVNTAPLVVNAQGITINTDVGAGPSANPALLQFINDGLITASVSKKITIAAADRPGDAGNDGSIVLQSAKVSGAGGTGSLVTISSGGAGDTGTGDISGGDIYVEAASAIGNGSGGNIGISAGAKAGTGNDGVLSIAAHGSRDDLNLSTQGFISLDGVVRYEATSHNEFVFMVNRATIAANTSTPTDMTNMVWADGLYKAAYAEYFLLEATTNQVCSGRLDIVQVGTGAVSYFDTRYVCSASFPTVVLTAVTAAGNVTIQATNLSATHNVYFAPMFHGRNM